LSYRKHHIKSKIQKLKPKKRFYKKCGFWYTVLFLFIVFTIVYLFLLFEPIQIDNVSISGNKKVKTEDIKNIVLLNIDKNISKSIFLADTQVLQKEILDKYPQINYAKVSKKLFKTINVEVAEKIPVSVFCQAKVLPEGCYFLDQGGVIFEALKDYAPDFSVIKKSQEEPDIFLGKKIFDKNVIDAVLKTKKILKENYNIDIREALLVNPSQLNIRSSESWEVLLNLEADVNLQIVKLDLLLKNEISEKERRGLSYIDMRFKDRAYYK